MKTKRIVSLILAAVMCLLAFPTMIIPASGDSLAATEEKADLEIGTKDELIAFANRVNSGETFEGKLVALTADIDLGGMAWTPIGYDSYGTSPEDAVSFNGTFDGRNHTISNLTDAGYIPTIITSGEYGFGLFGYAYGASFKNLKLANVAIHADGLDVADGAGVAALVGYYRIKSGKAFTIENCHLVSGSIYATNNMGGLVGYMEGDATAVEGRKFYLDGSIVGCTVGKDATVTTKKREAGGIVGLLNFSAANARLLGELVFTECKNYGTVIAEASNAKNSCAGGILGRDNTGDLYYFGGRLLFERCYNGGTVKASGIDGDEVHAGGIAVVFYGQSGVPAYMKGCVNEGDVSTEGGSVIYCGEILSYAAYAAIENCVAKDYANLYGGVGRMLFIEQPGAEIDETRAKALLYLNGAEAPFPLTFGESGGRAQENIVAKQDFFFDGWYKNPELTGEEVFFNNGGNDTGVFYAKFITLAEAYEKTAPGSTLSFGADITDGALVIDKDITIDLAGKTYAIGSGVSTFAMRAAGAPGLQIAEGVNVTIKNGTLTSDEAEVLIDSRANLTLENVTLKSASVEGSKALVTSAGTTTVKSSTIVAPVGGVAVEVSDDGTEATAIVFDTETDVSGKVDLVDVDGDGFNGSLTSGGETVTEAGTYVQYDTTFFNRLDTYTFSVEADRSSIKANETVNVTVSIDKAFYSAEYTFTYNTAMFACGADLDGDGVIYVTGLFEGNAGALATYTLLAKNDIDAVTDNVVSVSGKVLQYKEQVTTPIPNEVVGGSADITVSLNYTLAIKADYVPGCSLILVQGDDAGYAYNGAKMFYVDAYDAYAYLVEGAVTAADVDAAIAKTTGCETIALSYNVNAEFVDDGIVDLKDASVVYACTMVDFEVASYVELYLRADVNGDGVVNMVDINTVSANYTR